MLLTAVFVVFAAMCRGQSPGDAKTTLDGIKEDGTARHDIAGNGVQKIETDMAESGAVHEKMGVDQAQLVENDSGDMTRYEEEFELDESAEETPEGAEETPESADETPESAEESAESADEDSAEPTPDEDGDVPDNDDKAGEVRENTDLDVNKLMGMEEVVDGSEREEVSVEDGDDMIDDENAESEGDEDGDGDGDELETSMHKKKKKGKKSKKGKKGKNGKKGKGAKLGKLRKITLIVSSKTTAQVWRNFRIVGRCNAWRRAERMVFKARVGDSITIFSKGWTSGGKRIFGVAAIIKPGGKRWFVTGGRGGGAFRAISVRRLKAMGKKRKLDLRRPKAKMCFLRRPVVVTQKTKSRMAKGPSADLLYSKKARYVWARGAKATEPIGLRFVVGPRRCKKPKPTKKPTPTEKPTPGGARCACRVVRSASKGECFEFRNKRFSEIANKVGGCRRRTCGLKYECMQPGRRSRLLCVRRFARFEVRPVGPAFRGKCKNVRLRPAQPYYAPYA